VTPKHALIEHACWILIYQRARPVTARCDMLRSHLMLVANGEKLTLTRAGHSGERGAALLTHRDTWRPACCDAERGIGAHIV